MRRHPSSPQYDAPSCAHHLVAVDLGKRKVGLSVFLVDPDAGTAYMLKAVTVTCKAGAVRMAAEVWGEADLSVDGPVRWVCEWPMKYKDKRLYHEAISDLHEVGNEIDRLIQGWDEKYSPGEWKGNVPKAPHHRRIKRALTPEELTVMPPLAEHDAWDAAGIGLYATARTKRGAVPQKP